MKWERKTYKILNMATEDITTGFDIAEKSDWTPIESMIKVIGVGGGGCTADNYIVNNGVTGCSLIVCNTDEQALRQSPVPVKIHIGRDSLGAGTDPIKGRNAAVEGQEEIEQKVLGSDTKMLFITAGMGGGTGTGASPIIAKWAKDKGILTVAVVTLPFDADGSAAHSRAVDGINELVKNVDSLLIINNEKLYALYGKLLVHEALPNADEVLATAVRGITEIISKPGYINVDFEDIKTMMKDSGMALMGCGEGTGENRIEDAVIGALESPLLNDFDIKTAKDILINISCGKNKNGLTMAELELVDKKIEEKIGSNVNRFKRGLVYDTEEQGDRIKITAIATGFNVQDLTKITKAELGNIIVLDNSFTYTKGQTRISSDNSFQDMQGGALNIGYNKSDVKRFTINPDDTPVLMVEPGQRIAELSEIPAIKRQTKKAQ